VMSSHVHNYERFFQDGVMYIVSGGGGAMPYPVMRTPGDLFKSNDFPNYNYVEFVLEGKVLRGTMCRLSSKGAWQAMDRFQMQYH
jgi:acid phosphatase type 7